MYEVLEKLMRKKGVRFSDISRATGVSYSTFTDWKAGRYTPKAEKLQKIADYFGVSIEMFYGVEKNEHHDEYYVNKETAEMAQAIFEDDDLRILFDAAKDSTPHRIS